MLVVAQETQGGDVEVERLGRTDVQLHPGDGDRPQKVTVREGEDSTIGGGRKRDELRRSRQHLGRRLSTGAPIPVKLPGRARLLDGLGGEALVIAVLDLPEQRGHLWIRKTRELRGSLRSLEWARVDGVEFQLRKTIAQSRGLLLSMGCERQVGAPGVPAVDAPLRLAVSGEIDLEAQAGLPIISGLPERSDRLALSMTAPARTR